MARVYGNGGYNNRSNNGILFFLVLLSFMFILGLIYFHISDQKRITELETRLSDTEGRLQAVQKGGAMPSSESVSGAGDKTAVKGSYATSDDVKRLSSKIDSLTNKVNTNDNRIKEIESYMDEVDAVMQVLSKSFQTKVMPDDIYVEKNKGVLTHGPVKTDGNISKEYFDKVCSYYDMVPQKVRDDFVNDGWEVIVTSEDITDPRIKKARIAAVTSHGEQKIYVTVWDDASIIHEMGHYMDGHLGFISDFFPAKVYGEELGAFMDMNPRSHKHNYSTTSEYFAESFSFYVLHQDLLKKYCPGTYDFLTESLEKM